MNVEKKLLAKRYNYDGKIPSEFSSFQKKYIKQIERKMTLKGKKRSSCYICKSKSFQLVSEKDRFGIYYPVVICQDCGLVQTNPYYSEKEITDFYSQYYRRIYMGRANTKEDRFFSNVTLGKKLIAKLEKELGEKLSNLFVLDIGCGNGGISKAFQDHGNKAIGIDLCAPSYFNIGLKHNVDLRQSDLKSFISNNKNFKADFVILSHNVEHLLDPIKEFTLLKKIIHKDTLVFIRVPGLKVMKYYNYDYLNDYFQNAHKFHFSLESLNNMMKKAGYSLWKGDETIDAVYKISKAKQKIVKEDPKEVFATMKRIETHYQKNKFKIQSLKKVKNFLDTKLGFSEKHYEFIQRSGITKGLRKIIFRE